MRWSNDQRALPPVVLLLLPCPSDLPPPSLFLFLFLSFIYRAIGLVGNVRSHESTLNDIRCGVFRGMNTIESTSTVLGRNVPYRSRRERKEGGKGEREKKGWKAREISRGSLTR